MRELPRLITAMITPFKDDLSVDYEAAQKLAQLLINEGSEGLVISGTTGESPTLSVNEKMELFRAVKEAVGDKGYIIAGTGTNSTADCIKLTEGATKAGVDAVMIVVPYYNKPNAEGLYQHYKAAAGATDLPVILYNVPGRTGINMLPETVARLSEIKNIIAVKEASGNLDQVSMIRNMVPEDFIIYSGDDSLTLPMLSVGAYGVISVASHLVAPQIKEMITAYTAGEVKKAAAIHGKLFDLFRTMFITANPIPVKKALSLLGRTADTVRLPLVNATEDETEKIRTVMQQVGLL
ncbi:MAG: 4-hydroxy-tetrahydrodipicolinate synthase [Peptococcia bacterium]